MTGMTRPTPNRTISRLALVRLERETDSMGEIEVPADRYWERRRSAAWDISRSATIGWRSEFIAYGYVEKATALVNAAAGRLLQWKAEATVRTADEAITGKLDDHFTLCVWQTGSGTQSNMNANEVLSNRGDRISGRQDQQQGAGAPQRRRQYGAVVERHPPDRIGGCGQDRAHTSDGRGAIDRGAEMVGLGAPDPRHAGAHPPRARSERDRIGTEFSAPSNFGREIAELTGYPFVTAPNKFAAQGSLDGAVAAMGAVRGLAVALMKIANDMRCWHRDRVGVSASSCCRRTSRAPRRQPSRRRW
jgi:fumarate hydratase class II